MNKTELRQHFKRLRQKITPQRHHAAKHALIDKLLPELENCGVVLSFASLHEEIDMWPLNHILAQNNRLALPYLSDTGIIPYDVPKIEGHLIRSRYKILEPDPKICRKIDLREVGCILVPALCFDHSYHRLGFGMGYYDRFLTDLDIPTYGVGFTEQSIAKLPVEAHDIPLSKVYLF